ncbi:nuclear transport factor 2 family protein [Sphingoaurantiacus capsulatus]|uniref:Nuclear transport factor 2 family protein n=1 Tax=Sphingoaurantiacus capsulatus TaxID=1771310 RepID=A0ABV7X909_9SPHN
MSSETNKDIVRRIYEAMAKGDGTLFAASLHEDCVWRLPGQASWSRRFEGLDSVNRDLFRPLFARFATPYTAQLVSLIGEGDTVVAEVKGDVTTIDGARYANDYCFIFRFRDGKITEVVEYGDTALEDRVLGSYEDAVALLR